MGSNRRYSGHGIDGPVDAVIVRPKPIGLTEREVDPERNPITRAPEPIPAHAWVRFHEASIEPAVEIIEWNDRAVHIRWTMHGGQAMSAWVWKGAVRPLEQ